MRSTRRVLESSCFNVAGSEASLMPFVRPCMPELVSHHVFDKEVWGTKCYSKYPGSKGRMGFQASEAQP